MRNDWILGAKSIIDYEAAVVEVLRWRLNAGTAVTVIRDNVTSVVFIGLPSW